MSARFARGELLAVVCSVAVVSLSLGLGAWVLARGGGEEAAAVAPSTRVVAPEAAASTLLREPDALMLARRSGAVLVGLAAVRGGPVDLVVFEDEERALRDGAVRVSIDGGPPRRLTPGACGDGCVRLDAVALAGSPLRLAVEVERPGKPAEAVSFRLPALMPPDGTELLERAKRTMRALRSVTIDETLSAGATTVRSRWLIQAPDRVSVEASDGGSTVLIADRRWDLVDGEWVEGPGELGRQPWYPFEQATNARIIGTGTFRGVPVTRIAAFSPDPEPWWFVLDVAPDGRVLRERMLGPSHFMVDVFSRFDEPVSIEPPS